jgi:hypothetical protein
MNFYCRHEASFLVGKLAAIGSGGFGSLFDLTNIGFRTKRVFPSLEHN